MPAMVRRMAWDQFAEEMAERDGGGHNAHGYRRRCEGTIVDHFRLLVSRLSDVRW